jgi:hypothetical protein
MAARFGKETIGAFERAAVPTSTTAFHGGCTCGSVRYTCSERPLAQLICHCRDCQRASGSAFAASLIVPRDRLWFRGAAMREHVSTAASGASVRRRFCGTCGTPISIFRPQSPRVEFLQAGSLDDPATFRPTCEIWTSRASPWHCYSPDTEKFSEGPADHAVLQPIETYFLNRK